MNRDDIIRMAREAGVSIRGHYDETGSTLQELERFAALVAAEKDKQIAELQNDFDRVNSQSKTNLLYAARAIEERETARREEREACCKIVYGQCESDNVAQRTVDAIRARGEK